MSADFKSHVLLRDEKGFLGIPFKRLLLAAVGGGLVYTLVRLASAEMALPVGVVAVLALLILTGLRGGLPLWQRLIYRGRGLLLAAAAIHPTSLAARLAAAIQLPADLFTLDAALTFAPAQTEAVLDLQEWTLFASPVEADHDDGLTFVAAPLEDV
jgi:hypothetical protein